MSPDGVGANTMGQTQDVGSSTLSMTQLSINFSTLAVTFFIVQKELAPSPTCNFS